MTDASEQMIDMPTGTVTFLFTDIEGSTSMWDNHPMQMRDALARHDEILRATIEAHNGYVFKTVGDAFNATFRYPREALRAALAAQRALCDEGWGEPIEELLVRMALHTGFAEAEHDGDYFGPALNQAARLLSTGHGGQVLLSGATHNLVHDHPELVDEEARLIALGEYRLKGLTLPMHAYQLAVPDLRRDFPPLRANRTPDDFDERYRFRYFLGSGGFAKVYLAHDERLKRDVAVKVLHPQYVDQEQFVRRFEREARSVAKLSHPNIVTIHDWGQKKDGTYYMVMEYLPGGALKDLIVKEGPLPPSTAVAFALQVAQALEDAHRRGIVHRDIKPQNTLLSERGDVKVADFGIARAVSASTVSLSNSLLLGTPHYMSPEQVKGEPASFRSDLYSLGVVLYEMLTGELPFDAETPIGLLNKHLHEQVRSPKEINPDVPEGIETVTLRLLARDPKDRYPDAAALMNELKGVLRSLEDKDGRVIVGRPVSEGVLMEEGFAETIIDETEATPSTVEVPNLAGKNASQASSTLANEGLTLGDQKEVTSDTIPKGEIMEQTPEAGTEVDPDSFVSISVSSGSERAGTTERLLTAPGGLLSTERRRIPAATLLTVALAVLALAAVIGGLYFFGRSFQSAERPVEEAPAAEQQGVPSANQPDPVGSPDEAAEDTAPQPVRATVSVVGPSTGMTIRTDETVAYNQVAQPGFSETFEARETLTVEARNGGAVEVEVEGQEAERLGSSGQPATREFTPEEPGG